MDRRWRADGRAETRAGPRAEGPSRGRFVERIVRSGEEVCGDKSEVACLAVSGHANHHSRSKPAGREGAGSCAPFQRSGRSSEATEETEATEATEATEQREASEA